MEQVGKYQTQLKGKAGKMDNMYTGKCFIIVELCLYENKHYGPYHTAHEANTDLDKLMSQARKPREQFAIVELLKVQDV